MSEFLINGKDPFESYGHKITSGARYKWAISKLKKIKAKNVLEMGCGSGFGTHLIKSAGFNVTGMDGDKELIEIAKKKYKDIDFQVSDVVNFDYSNKEKYDAIVSLEVIEHLSDYKKAIKNWKKLIKTGGFLILSTPNIKYSKHDNPLHLHEFAYDEIKNLLPGCKIEGFNFRYLFTKPITLLFGGERSMRFRFHFADKILGRPFPRFSNNFLIVYENQNDISR